VFPAQKRRPGFPVEGGRARASPGAALNDFKSLCAVASLRKVQFDLPELNCAEP
jgi:hypothetical protein